MHLFPSYQGGVTKLWKIRLVTGINNVHKIKLPLVRPGYPGTPGWYPWYICTLPEDQQTCYNSELEPEALELQQGANWPLAPQAC
eukprot:212829-Rhodomonas_salina.1